MISCPYVYFVRRLKNQEYGRTDYDLLKVCKKERFTGLIAVAALHEKTSSKAYTNIYRAFQREDPKVARASA